MILIVVVAVTVGAIVSMLKKRVDNGENYPAYSSMRPDPQGTRVLYEALDRLPGVNVERNFRRLKRLEGKVGRTFVFAGVGTQEFNYDIEADPNDIARLAVEGSRVVLTLDTSYMPGRMWRNIERAERELEKERNERDDKKLKEENKKPTAEKDKKSASGKPETKPAEATPPTQTKAPESEKKSDSQPKAPEVKKETQGKKKKTDEELEFERKVSLAQLLKVRVDLPSAGNMEKDGILPKPVAGTALAAVEIPRWHTLGSLDDDQGQNWKQIRLDGLRSVSRKIDEILTDDERHEDKDPAKAVPEPPPPVVEKSPWTTLATALDKPVIMERKLGSGSVVITSDRYFISNEALWEDKHPAFLAWLIGPASEVVFEETHLGNSIGDGEGIMTLARQYRMHGLFVGGLLFFALFIWRSVTSLVPHDPDADLGHWRQDAVAGQSAASGLEGMLRRGIRLEGTLSRALSVWRSTPAASGRVPKERAALAEAEVSSATSFRTFPVIYRRIRDILHPSRKP